MKKTLLLFAVSMLLLSCGRTKQIPQDPVVRWSKDNLKGKIRSIIAISSRYSLASGEDEYERIDRPVETNVILQIYNTKGKLSESRRYNNDSVLVRRSLFEYDKSGLLTQSDYIDYNAETQHIDSSRFLYTYSDEKVAKEEFYFNGKLLSRTETGYNDNDDIILCQSFKEGEKTGDSKYEYLYNDKGLKTERKAYANGLLDITTSWEYDSKGRLIAVKTQDGELVGSESYTYDRKDRLVEETLTSDDSGTVCVNTYLYDERNNMVKHLQRTQEGGILKQGSYTYDKHGNWTRSIEESETHRTICERSIKYGK